MQTAPATEPCDTDLLAPMPPRLPDTAPIWRKLLRARENLVAGWTEGCFQWQRFEFTALNQRYVVCNSPKHVRRVFLDNHDNYDRKSPQMRRSLEPLLGDGLFVSDGELWRQRREICAPALRSTLLPAFTPRFVDTAGELVERWRTEGDGQRDILVEMAELTARIIGRTVFGDDTSQDEAAQVVAGFSQYVASIEQVDLANSLGLPALRLLPSWFRADADARAAREVHDVIDRIIARHRRRDRREGEPPTLLALFLDAESAAPGDAPLADAPPANTAPPMAPPPMACPMSAKAARNEAIVMFMAGHETTANTLAWAFYLMAAAPEWGKRLRAEVDTVLAGRPPTLDDMGRLDVARAIIEETLRLYPPVPVLGRQARGRDKLGTYEVREGDIVLVVPWLLHRHNLFWEAPNAFRPQRFLNTERRPDRFVYIPFSAGPRVCLGQRFGMTEAVFCLAMIAQHFELNLSPGQEVEVSGRLTLRPKGGLPMQVRARRAQ